MFFSVADGASPVLLVAGLGLVLGIRHSTDPDHVVAVSTIVSRQRSIRKAAIVGSIWGLGHTVTIFVAGGLIIAFGVVIPPRLGLTMEFLVGVMLIVLGVLNLTGLMQQLTSRFSHTHGTEAIVPQAAASSRLSVYQMARPLFIGIVHGLAGSAAVALLVLSTIHSPMWATMYLLIFGAGTMVGMMVMTMMMALPMAFAGDRFARVSQYLTVASGLVSVCFGAFVVYHLAFGEGLFTCCPLWTPR